MTILKIKNVGDVKQTSPTVWKWTITAYSAYLPDGKLELLSPKISIKQSDGTTNWLFKAYPNGKSDRSSNFLSLMVQNLDEIDVIASIEFAVLNETNNVIFVSPLFSQELFDANTKSFGRSKFVSHEFLNDEFYHIFTDNTLKLQFRIIVDEQLHNVKSSGVDFLVNDFEKLLDNGKHSDVTFTIGKEKIDLHKAILSSRSPVFQAMFEHDMKENKQNAVKITDIKWDVFKEMCHYMYAGKVKEIGSIAKDLLIAADKYCIEGLKALCEKIICDQLNMDNALEYLQLAKTYNARFLKIKVYQFVKSNIEDLYSKPQFDELDARTVKEIMGYVLGIESLE